MMLTWHIIKKDVRRFWPVALFLAFLVLLECYWGYLLLSVSPGDGFDTALFNRINGYSSTLAHLQLLAVVVFTAALIHEDGFASTTKYWMTRPISNRRLLAAKGVTLFLLCGVVPALAAVPWWLYAGWGPDQLLWGAAKMGAPVCALVLFSAPFALVTSNLSRFLLSILIGILAFAVMTFSITQLGLRSGADLAPALGATRAVVAGWMLLGVSVSVIALHLSRNLSHLAMKVLAAGTFAWITISLSWNWALPTWVTFKQSESSLTAGITARPLGTTPMLIRQGSQVFLYNLTFELTGTPKGNFITGSTGPGQRLIWPDDEKAINVVAPFSTASDFPNVRQLLALDRNGLEALPAIRFASRLHIPPAVWERVRETPPSYEMIGNFRLLSPKLLGEIPHKAGAKIARSGHTIQIIDEQGEFAGRFISLVESKPSSRRSNLWYSWDPSEYDDRLHEGTLHHYIINRRLGRLYRGVRPLDSTALFRRCSIAHVEIVWRRLIFREDFDPSPSADGLGADQELAFAVIGSTEVASFQRRILFPSTMLGVP